eukprot:352013-Chlamydomonas_euryale.AAC.3
MLPCVHSQTGFKWARWCLPSQVRRCAGAHVVQGWAPRVRARSCSMPRGCSILGSVLQFTDAQTFGSIWSTNSPQQAFYFCGRHIAWGRLLHGQRVHEGMPRLGWAHGA